MSNILLQTLADAWKERESDPWTQKALRPGTDDAGGRPMEAAAEPLLHARSAQGFDLEMLLPLAVAVLHSAPGSRGPDSDAAEEVRLSMRGACVLHLALVKILPALSACPAPPLVSKIQCPGERLLCSYHARTCIICLPLSHTHSTLCKVY